MWASQSNFLQRVHYGGGAGSNAKKHCFSQVVNVNINKLFFGHTPAAQKILCRPYPRDWTCAPCSGSTEPQPLDRQGIPLISYVGSSYPWYDVGKWHSILVIFFSQIHNSNLIMRKTSDTSQLRDIILQNRATTPQNCQINQKQETSKKLSQQRGVITLITKCHVVSRWDPITEKGCKKSE